MKKRERIKLQKQLAAMVAGSKTIYWPRFVIFDAVAVDICQRASEAMGHTERKLCKRNKRK
jgi:hypothetical protein